jgi:tetratricopeptide (TPR) repeat protein
MANPPRETQAALLAAQRALESSTDPAARAAALMNRGRALRAMGRLEDAVADFDEVVSLAPLHPLPYLDRGTVRLMREENAAAIPDLDKAIALLPDEPDWGRQSPQVEAGRPQADPIEQRGIAYSNRGIGREGIGDAAGAFRDMRAALALGWQPARDEIDRMTNRNGAVAGDPAVDRASAIALCAKARATFSHDRLEALVLFQQAVELAPDLQEAQHGLGIVNAALNRLKEAASAFARSLAIRPQQPGVQAESLFNRSSLREESDRAGAIADLEACLELIRDGAGFPDFGDAAKNVMFIAAMQQRLDRLKSEPVSPR